MIRFCSFVAVLVWFAGISQAGFMTESQLTDPAPGDGDQFGFSVGISGNTAIVGARFDDDGASDAGSAFLFDATTGSLLHQLTAPTPGIFDTFGNSVAISGNTAIIGAVNDDDGAGNSGSAFLFDATTGDFLHQLAAPTPEAGDQFGSSVGISGNTVIVGAVTDDDGAGNSGSAFLFDATTGDFLHQLTAPTPEAGDFFGFSVGISGNTAIVGAVNDDDGGTNTGSAFLFDATTGAFLHQLTAPTPEAGDQFGNSVAISGSTAIVGASRDDDDGLDSGSAFLFDATTGAFLHELVAPTPEAFDNFGNSVAISGNTAIVGVVGDDDGGSSSGSAFLFDVATGDLLQQLTAPVPGVFDFFGNSVAISGNTAIIGAFNDDDGGTNSGSAFLFSSPPEPAAVPEPGTLAIFGAIGCAAALRRRRSRPAAG